MYKRLELHNHTTESDASLSPLELIEYLVQDHVDAFAITDHNTISGHAKIKDLIQKHNFPIECIYGMEYTTYYGHILCLNLKEYVPWEDINLHKPEQLFAAARAKGALVGVAHPYSYGHPFARGCRFDMTITDFTSFDYIEIFNNLEPLHEVNERGLLWWEELVLNEYPMAFTCGMDLHGKWDMSNHYATYIEGTPGGAIDLEIENAIRSQRTWISRGPILETKMNREQRKLSFQIIDTGKPGYSHDDADPYYLVVRTKKGTFTREISAKLPIDLDFDLFEEATILLPKLYHKDAQLENLVCVAPTIYL